MTGTAYPIIGYGTTLEANDSGSYTAFTFPMKYNCPSGTTEKVDISGIWMANLSKQYIPGYNDPGTLEFTLQYCAADYLRLEAMMGAKYGWKIIIPTDGTGTTRTVAFSGFLTKYPIQTIDTTGIVQITCEVQISGALTVT